MTLREIFTFENLKAAHEQCRQDKQHKRGTIMFEMDLGQNLATLEKQLQAKTYKIGKYKPFILFDPKERTIEALPYKDRVVLMCFCKHSLEPRIERRLVYDNAASRRGKGTHFAINRLHGFMQQSFKDANGNGGYYLKCDISKYFQSVDQAILIDKVKHMGFSADEIWFMELVIKSYTKSGVPLGNQTSQWFALLYLDEVDRLIKEKLRIKHYTRYMDDFILLHHDKEYLRHCKAEIEKACGRLKMRLNSKTQIGTLRCGIDYLGFNHKLRVDGKIERRVRASAMMRHKRYLRVIAELHDQEIIDDDWLSKREQAFLNHMKGTMGGKVVSKHMREIRAKAKIKRKKRNNLKKFKN